MCAAHANPDRAQARRQQVLEAAAECFRRRGFHAASMAEIAKTAGMSAGHIYNLFKNKDDVIAAIVERDRDEIVRRIQEDLARPGIDLALFVGCVEENLQNPHRQDEAALNLEVLAEASRNPALAQAVIDSDTAIRQKAILLIRMALGPAAQALSEHELEARASVISALFSGLMVLTITQPEMNQGAFLAVMQRVMRTLIDPNPTLSAHA